MCQLISQQAHDPRLAPALLFAQGSGPYWDAARQLDCPVVSLDLSSGRDLRGLGRAAQAMKTHAVHHFHAAEPLLMLASIRCRDAKRVYTHRGGVIDYPARKRVQYAAAGLLLRRRFHGVSGNTAHAAVCASRLFRIDRERIRVTYNGLDFSRLEPKRPAKAVRKELGLEATDFVLGTAADLRRWKRIDRLLHLLRSIPDAGLRLLIVGDGEDRQRLEALAAQLDLGKRVVFSGLQLHVGDYLQVMDAFCLPSMALESFGNAAVEAMAAGVPTIVFADGGGTVEHIDSGQTGFIVEDQRELESTLRRLIDDTDMGSRIAERGRNAVRARYTLESSAREFAALYASVL